MTFDLIRERNLKQKFGQVTPTKLGLFLHFTEIGGVPVSFDHSNFYKSFNSGRLLLLQY
jgi:hypothetical protein